MKFFLEMSVDIDPADWEGAGYDPLEASLAGMLKQISDWAVESQWVGAQPVDTQIHSIRLGSAPRPVNGASLGFHVMTLTRAPLGDLLQAEDENGELLAQVDPTSEDWVDLVDKAFWSIP